jgi:hypothetical protein
MPCAINTPKPSAIPSGAYSVGSEASVPAPDASFGVGWMGASG